jgi:integrase
MQVQLTDSAIAKASREVAEGAQRRELIDKNCAGLCLRVGPLTKTWFFTCRHGGSKPRRFTLGTFPTVGLSKARELAQAMREEIRQGRGPAHEAQKAREAEEVMRAEEAAIAAKGPEPTLKDLLDDYGRAVGALRRSWPESRKRIESVFAAHLSRPSISITAPELQVMVDAHPSRSSAGAAVRYVRPVLKWGVKRGRVVRGVSELDQPEGALTVRERRLNRVEMGAILRALDGSCNYGRAMRWLFWTGCRLNEACGMRWGDVTMDAGVWTIPQTKSGGMLAVPLPNAAVGMLRSILPVDDNGGKMTPDPDSLVFGTKSGNRLANWDKATRSIQKTSETAGWHRHDIRRSVATLMADEGVAPHIVEVCLGHALRSSSDGQAVSRVARVYNKSRYEREHAAALALLANALHVIEHGAHVIPLRRAV